MNFWGLKNNVPFGILMFGHWNLFEICDLEFVISAGAVNHRTA